MRTGATSPHTCGPLCAALAASLLLLAGCVPVPTPMPAPADPSTTIDVPPFAYSGALGPAVVSAIDGLYSRVVPFEGTPTPCKRCAGYRVEGGVWTLYLDRGIYKVYHQGTGFVSIGSYEVSGSHVTLFNDPYCEEDLAMIGAYSWVANAESLRLTAIEDPCSIGLRARNLASEPWTRVAMQTGGRDPCQPPNREAAVSGHWVDPESCSR